MAAWRRWLKLVGFPLPAHQIFIDEIGIAAQSGAFSHPSKGDWGTRYIASIQSNWYLAACTFARQVDAAGFFVWTVEIGQPGSSTLPGPMDVQPGAAAAVRQCFRLLTH